MKLCVGADSSESATKAILSRPDRPDFVGEGSLRPSSSLVGFVFVSHAFGQVLLPSGLHQQQRHRAAPHCRCGFSHPSDVPLAVHRVLAHLYALMDKEGYMEYIDRAMDADSLAIRVGTLPMLDLVDADPADAIDN